MLIWNITAGGARLTSSVSTPGAADVQVLCFGNMGIYDHKKDLLKIGSVSFEDWYWFNVLLKLALLDPYTSGCRQFSNSGSVVYFLNFVLIVFQQMVMLRERPCLVIVHARGNEILVTCENSPGHFQELQRMTTTFNPVKACLEIIIILALFLLNGHHSLAQF